jgi:hypothetical protein
MHPMIALMLRAGNYSMLEECKVLGFCAERKKQTLKESLLHAAAGAFWSIISASP